MLHVLLQNHHVVGVFLTRHVNSEISRHICFIITNITPPGWFRLCFLQAIIDSLLLLLLLMLLLLRTAAAAADEVEFLQEVVVAVEVAVG